MRCTISSGGGLGANIFYCRGGFGDDADCLTRWLEVGPHVVKRLWCYDIRVSVDIGVNHQDDEFGVGVDAR